MSPPRPSHAGPWLPLRETLKNPCSGTPPVLQARCQRDKSLFVSFSSEKEDSCLPSRKPRLALALLLGLSACGFHPLYADAPPVPGGRATAVQLDGIYVALIPERTGQLLRQALQARLDQRSGTPRTLQLNVVYTIEEESIGVQPDNSTSRTRAVARAAWTLTRPSVPGSPVVTSGAARSLDGFNTVNEQYFFSVLENENAQRRLADAIADQITAQLASYMRAHPTQG